MIGVRPSTGEVPRAPRRAGGNERGAAAPATDPCRTAGVRARKTGCRAVASRDASGGQRPGIGRCRPNLVVDGDRRIPLRLVAVVGQAGAGVGGD